MDVNVAGIFAREKGSGLWHRARETYQGSALTDCGRSIEASRFATHPHEVESSPVYCSACDCTPPLRR